jgi:hypothetical protein
MNVHAPLAHGLLTADGVVATCLRARAAGESIAVLLGPLGQPGVAMLAQLEKASRAADRLLLIEPPSTDAGSLAVLAALRPVDWVVQADESARVRLLEQLCPDALLHAEVAQ